MAAGSVEHVHQEIDAHAMLGALTRVQNRFIVGAMAGELFDALLATLLELTGAGYGFIGEVLHDPDGTPYLRTQAITDISWSEETRRFYAENAPDGLEFRNLDTLFGAVIREERAIATNDPASHPASAGVPEGHPPLASFLGIPFHSRGELVGMVGIANRPAGFTEALVAELDPLLSTCANLVLAFQGQRRLAEAHAGIAARDHDVAALFAAMGEGVLAVEPDGTIRVANPAAGAILGFEDLLGRPLADILERPDADADADAGGDGDGAWRVTARRADGTTLPLAVTATRLASGSKLYCFRDATAQQETEGALRRARDEAERLNRAKDEFLAAVSHEIRTPLTAVIGFAELLNDGRIGELAPTQASVIRRMGRSGRQLLWLVNDLLDVAALTASSVRLELDAILVGDVVEEAVTRVREAVRADLTPTVDVPGDLGPIVADRRRVEQILSHLLDNAVRAANGSGAVGVEACGDDDEVSITVWDTGLGIAPEHLPHLFQPFSPADPSQGSRYRGAGIGLALSRRLARLHGGDLTVTSVQGEGSRFTLTLPRAADPLPLGPGPV